MSFEVILTDEAATNLRETFRWLEELSPQGAINWLNAFEEAKQRLEQSPESCGRAPENPFCERELRQILFKTRRGRLYRAIFYVQDQSVIVTHIRGPRQQLLRSDQLPNAE
jgi:plasmid stabilization system protein ParE